MCVGLPGLSPSTFVCLSVHRPTHVLTEGLLRPNSVLCLSRRVVGKTVLPSQSTLSSWE